MLLIVGGMEAAAADSSLCSSLFSVSGASGASVGPLVVTSGEGACCAFRTLCDLLRGVSMARADSGGLVCWSRAACWIGLMAAVGLGAAVMAPGVLSSLEVSVSPMLLVPSTVALSTLTRDLCINSDP